MLKQKSLNKYSSENNFANKSITFYKFRNNSTNNFYEKDLGNKVLPKINTQKIKYEPKLTESYVKSSNASTFYSTNEHSQRVLTETKPNKNILNYLIMKQKS